MRLLLDVNVPRFAAQSTERVVGKKETSWGPHRSTLDIIDHGPLYSDVDRFVRDNVPFIPSLAIEGRKRGIEFFTSELLTFERWNVPPAIDWAGRDIISLFELQELPFEIRGSCMILGGREDAFANFLTFLENQFDDETLTRLIKSPGKGRSRDCCHAFLAHRFDLDGFITMDKDFIGRFNQVRNSLRIKLRSYSPKEICRKMRIDPISQDWFRDRADTNPTYRPCG